MKGQELGTPYNIVTFQKQCNLKKIISELVLSLFIYTFTETNFVTK